MASSGYNTILLEVNGQERPILEKEANVALTPGELVAISSGKLIPHGTAAGGAVQKMFCVENPYAEPSANAAIDTDWAQGDYARYIYGQPGDLVYAWLKDGQSVAEGAALVSDGAGALQAAGTVDATLITNSIVAYAEETAAPSGARGRIRVRVA